MVTAALAYLAGMFGLKTRKSRTDDDLEITIPREGVTAEDYDAEVTIVQMTEAEREKVFSLIDTPAFHPCMKYAGKAITLIMGAKLSLWQAGHHVLEDVQEGYVWRLIKKDPAIAVLANAPGISRVIHGIVHPWSTICA